MSDQSNTSEDTGNVTFGDCFDAPFTGINPFSHQTISPSLPMPEFPQPIPKWPVVAPQGWQCPLCQSVWSPIEQGCLTCNNDQIRKQSKSFLTET